GLPAEHLDVVAHVHEGLGEVSDVDALPAHVRLAAVGEQRDAQRRFLSVHSRNLSVPLTARSTRCRPRATPPSVMSAREGDQASAAAPGPRAQSSAQSGGSSQTVVLVVDEVVVVVDVDVVVVVGRGRVVGGAGGVVVVEGAVVAVVVARAARRVVVVVAATAVVAVGSVVVGGSPLRVVGGAVA